MAKSRPGHEDIKLQALLNSIDNDFIRSFPHVERKR